MSDPQCRVGRGARSGSSGAERRAECVNRGGAWMFTCQVGQVGMHVSSLPFSNPLDRRDAVLSLHFLTQLDVSGIEDLLILAKEDRNAITKSALNDIQHKIFMDIYNSTYLSFRKTEEYKTMKEVIKTTFNRVSCDDFELFELLGEGG